MISAHWHTDLDIPYSVYREGLTCTLVSRVIIFEIKNPRFCNAFRRSSVEPDRPGPIQCMLYRQSFFEPTGAAPAYSVPKDSRPLKLYQQEHPLWHEPNRII